MDILHNCGVEVQLTKGLVTSIDAEDLDLVMQHKWCAQQGGNTYYAVRKQRIRGKQQAVLLHRFLLNAADGMHVDHINSNGLDNTKANLRLCTPTENGRNRQKQAGGFSRFKGVSKRSVERPKIWTASLYVGEKKYTQYFHTELEAALCYDKMAREHFGEFAKLNFPQS